MHNILITEPEYFSDEAVRILKKAGKVTSKRLTRAQLEKAIANVDIIMVRIETKLDRRLLSRAKRLKVIGSATTGLDHIDLKYAKERGIAVINLHGTHTVPTAEHTFELLLSLARKTPWAFESLRGGEWHRERFFGTQMEGKTLGIIGLGRIGSRVAGYASAFGMKVIAYDPHTTSRKVNLVSSLNVLLKKSDIITIHASLNDETEGMISYNQFKLMKKGALLINTARGRMINERALLNALKKREILGAALDVFVHEPLVGRNDPLVRYARENKNLIITPHLGASTNEAIARAGLEIATNIIKYIN